MTRDEASRIAADARLLWDELQQPSKERSFDGFNRFEAAQLVAGAMPVLIQDVRANY